MAHRYPFQEIEKKWQAQWELSNVYRTLNPTDPGFDATKTPFYVLDMFPYPSGSGLHVGHASGYIGTDIIARRERMRGRNVLHPMGWDAFGLPAEQYAIQTGQHPELSTQKNTAAFRAQLKKIALCYDWTREINTSSPDYYRWTQWIFLQLYKKGLVYRKEMPVWWCEELKTVLANEEVINGRSERGNYPCERRPLEQWVFRITAYADRLLTDLEELDWPESIKKQQRDWIGKSEGAEIDFVHGKSKSVITVFSTRPDTLFGVVALVLAPEHPLVSQLTSPENAAAVKAYVQKTKSKSDRERKAEAEEMTVQRLGETVEHPLIAGLQVPVFIGDYVLLDYGTGAVMAVPAHDERDEQMAKVAGLPVKKVIQAPGDFTGSCYTGEGNLEASGPFTGLPSTQARSQIIQALTTAERGRSRISYKIRDWVFSRQRYWGEPFPLYIDEHNNVLTVDEADLPVTLPLMTQFEPNADGSSPLNRVPEWVHVTTPDGRKLRRVTDTMPGWAGSCWYYLRFMDPNCTTAAVGEKALNYWRQVDLYVGGASHAVMHLLYARFWHKVLLDLGLVPTKEPFKKLFNQGMVTAFAFRGADGRLVPTDQVQQRGMDYFDTSSGQKVERFISKMAKSLRNVVNPDDVITARGCDAFRLFSMFMGPLDDEKPWTDEGMAGCENFLNRLWLTLVEENGDLRVNTNSEDPDHNRSLHKALKRIDESFEKFNFNTAVAAFMEALNEIRERKTPLSLLQIKMLAKMLAPFAPFISAELWEKTGEKSLINDAIWPEVDPNLLVVNEFELVLQINGKIKKRLLAPMNLSKEALEQLALSELAENLAGQTPKKIITVVNKLVNVVVH